MDIQGDLSKSTYATALKCPWKAYAHKVMGLRSESNQAAENGIVTHQLWGEIIRGTTRFDDALEAVPNDNVRFLLKQAILNEPIPWADDHILEAYRSFDGIGGYLDRTGDDPADGMVHFVEDLKTGRREEDDPFERDAYVYLEWKASGRTPIKFVRYFCRSGNAYTYHYMEHDLNGQVTDNVMAALETIRRMEPLPNPGDHCSNWYGTPCQFLGAECPLSQVPALVDTQAPLLGKAFLSVRNGDINPQSAGFAFQACQQLQRAVDDVMDRIKLFAKNNGPISVGEDRIGWQSRDEYVVDKAYALELLRDFSVDYESAARMISVSKSSIMRLPKRYDNVKKTLLALAVKRDGEVERFQKL